MIRAAILFGFLISLQQCAYAQDFFDDEPPEYLPGLIATYECDGKSITKIDSEIQFDWTVERLDPRLAHGTPFRARWEGILNLKEDGKFQFHAFLAGAFKLTINDELVIDAELNTAGWVKPHEIELEFGRHDLKVEYDSKAAGTAARLGLFWSGENFQLEPLAAQHLIYPTFSLDDVTEPLQETELFELGQALSRGLRCAACHNSGTEPPALGAPSLTHLQGNLRPSWLVEHLTSAPQAGDGAATPGSLDRRMPYFGLHRNSAAAITAALFDASAAASPVEDVRGKLRAAEKRRGKKDPKIRTQPDSKQGATTLASAGCLACHQVGELGNPSSPIAALFSGGDLSTISAKRTSEFFARWLKDPASVNAHARMPKVSLSLNERLDLQAHLVSLGADRSRNDTRAFGDKDVGAGLIARHQCGACHQLPKSLQSPLKTSTLSAASDWDGGCLTTPNTISATPGFGLNSIQRLALKTYFAERVPQAANSEHKKMFQVDGKQLIAEANCLSCHDRNTSKGISSQLVEIAKSHPELSVQLAGLTPPAITGVGDKLHASAIKNAISRKTSDLRPWLSVRMPHYQFEESELQLLAEYLISKDRIPDARPDSNPADGPKGNHPVDLENLLAAQRLVTAEGFGCQSCHAIGDMETPKVDLKAKGTNLAMLGSRVRPSWFQRWVRNPSRIVARMEMPAINTAVKGVMSNDLDRQLDALWETLNTPDFKPPRPNPVRTVRNHNDPAETGAFAKVLTCVVETPNKKFLRPLIIGLPNRHNVLFDLESGQLAAWWTGDVARQYTRGKTWYWESGNDFLNSTPLVALRLKDLQGRIWKPEPQGQFVTKFDSLQHLKGGGVAWQGRLRFVHRNEALVVDFSQKIAVASSGAVGEACEVESSIKVPAGTRLLIDFAGELKEQGVALQFDLPNGCRSRMSSTQGRLQIAEDSERTVELQTESKAETDGDTRLAWKQTLKAVLPADSFPRPPLLERQFKPRLLDVVPGFEAVQLPLPTDEMPIAFTWDSNGRGYVGSLKGRVLQMWDADADGLEDSYEVISDEIPTPYGLHYGDDGLDVLSKYALLRLTPSEMNDGESHSVWNSRVVADGWGYTADYHDWAVGLEIDQQGNYWIAIPCQQDERSEAAAYLRGHAVKLVRNDESHEHQRAYRLESYAAGLRFPMGIALDKEGNLFTSDNQGNYNPFNELNHLRPGKRYGFINKLENKDGFSPDFEMPAINIPHPWVRSVNGMCFLTTPSQGREENVFGQFEGHLIGCEMNGRSLIRMTLQKVGDTFQGAAYMFSRPAEAGEKTFEGPIVCEISPNGALYVGNLLDSGWGGGNNTGSVVRLKPQGKLPMGIREVTATPNGFHISFTDKLDPPKASQPDSYRIRSYTRVSTPAYGGDDQQERSEQVSRVEVADDCRSVTIELDKLRGDGCVYEINVAPVGVDEQALFPKQAHYTMRAIPH